MSGSDKLKQNGVVAPRTFGSLRKTSLGLGAPPVLAQAQAAPLVNMPASLADEPVMDPPAPWQSHLVRAVKAPLPRVNAGLSTAAIAALALVTLAGLVAASLYVGHKQSSQTNIPPTLVRSSQAGGSEELNLYLPGSLPGAGDDAPGSSAGQARRNTAVAAPLSTGSALSEPLGRPAVGKGFDRPGLDQRVVASAIAAERSAVKSCLPEASGPVRVRVTFAPDGSVMGAKSLSEPFANTAAGTCLEASLRRVSIPPFTGEPLAVETLLSP